METLVLVAEHKNQYYSRCRDNGSARFRSPPSKDFHGTNCRSYESGVGLLPTPIKTKSCVTPITKQAISASVAHKTLSPFVKSRSEEPKKAKKWAKSNVTTIPIKMKLDEVLTKDEVITTIPMKMKLGEVSTKEEVFYHEFHFSELWAGPAYSNSPPPSSLPIPKFSAKPKRTVSLELPSTAKVIDMHPIAKSAPASPTRGRSLLPRDFLDEVDCATKTLRRILNLDVTDD